MHGAIVCQASRRSQQTVTVRKDCSACQTQLPAVPAQLTAHCTSVALNRSDTQKIWQDGARMSEFALLLLIICSRSEGSVEVTMNCSLMLSTALWHVAPRREAQDGGGLLAARKAPRARQLRCRDAVFQLAQIDADPAKPSTDP